MTINWEGIQRANKLNDKEFYEQIMAAALTIGAGKIDTEELPSIKLSAKDSTGVISMVLYREDEANDKSTS